MRVWKLICPNRILVLFGLVYLFFSRSFLMAESVTEILAEQLFREGAVSISSVRQDVSNERNLYYDSRVETGSDGFAVFSFYSGLFLKAGANTIFKVNSFAGIGVLSIHLLQGELFLHIPHIPPKGQKKLNYELQTPMGFISSALGDFYIAVNLSDDHLQILSLEDRQIFEFGNLEYSLNSGEKLVVSRGRVFPKVSFSGTENRNLYSWYKRGVLAPLPSYFQSLQEYDREQKLELVDFSLNGLSDGEWRHFPVLGARDLVLGRIRLEGFFKNKQPHQVLQISTDGGKNFFDVDYDDEQGFLIKLLPEEREYKIYFRARDFERFYSVTQEEIEFVYQNAGLRDLLLEWKKEIEDLFNHKRSEILTVKFADCGRFGRGLGEILREEFNQHSFQRLEMFILRVGESRDAVNATFRWNMVYTRDDIIDPIRLSGVWRLIFRTKGMNVFCPVESSGEPPFGVKSSTARVDRKGPRIYAPLVYTVSGVGPALISDIRIEDDLSNIQKVEYFFDRIGRVGSGRQLAAKDGSFDSRLEYIDLLVPASFRGDRIFLRALDTRGNWSEPQGIVIHRP